MQDVATAVGVTRMSVSLAMRNSPSISPATCERIQAAARSMGYHPDPLIQRLATHLGRSHLRREAAVIAWVNSFQLPASDRQGYPFTRIYNGAVAAAERHGFQLEEFWINQPRTMERRLSQVLYQRGIECVLVAPIDRPGGRLRLDWDKFSAVAIGYSMNSPQLNRVVNHQLHAARLALSKLTRQGYRRIGLCTTVETNLRVDNNWINAIAFHQYRQPPERCVPPLLLKSWNDHSFLQLVRQNRPDCILTHQYWAGEVLKRAGYTLPDDLGIAILDGPVASAPEMSGIDQRHEEVGAKAVEAVMGHAYRHETGVPDVPLTTMVEGTWFKGESSPRRPRNEQ